MTLPLALTMGEPAGIGGEIALQAWLRRRDGVPLFYLIDDPGRLAGLACRLGWSVPVRTLASPQEAPAVFADSLPVLPGGGTPRGEPGRPDSPHAPLVIGAIRPAGAPARRRRATPRGSHPHNKY